MKFSLIDKQLQNESFNPLDLVHFDEFKENIDPNLPIFIRRGEYIKTITKVPGVDFFNLSPYEQEEKVNYFGAFLSSLKSGTQIFVHSKPIDTNKYLKEAKEQILNSPYLNENVKEAILNDATGLNATLNFIKQDGRTSKFVKEYYIITSSKIGFNGEMIEENENEVDNKEYTEGVYSPYSSLQWETYMKNFNEYYHDIFGLLVSLFEENSQIEPLTKEEEVIGLFAELNNDIKKESINEIKNII